MKKPTKYRNGVLNQPGASIFAAPPYRSGITQANVQHSEPMSTPQVNQTTKRSTTVQPTGGAQDSPTSGQQEDMTGFEKDCLESHNEYREKHGVPPLKWNQQLKEDAQRWANILAQRNMFEHDRERNDAGENLAYFLPPKKQCQGQKKRDCVQCREMVADWYNEIQDYNFDIGKSKNNGGVILHFTQVVWKETTELGMATAESANKFITVARYRPKGNIGSPEDFKKDVPKPKPN